MNRLYLLLMLVPCAAVASGGIFTDRSGSITAGGVSQVLAASNPRRLELIIANPSTSVEPLCFNYTAVATVLGGSSICLAPGEKYIMENGNGRFISTEAINVIATTSGHVYQAKEK